ncbi:hypothetical protein BDW74DRAFT_15473 [Aspergillus multicolor]|uniref:uncharacterized protein n=1 Tax=Aspergillus multicolor TaxID=41759 RepID=UPI003CCD66E5
MDARYRSLAVRLSVITVTTIGVAGGLEAAVDLRALCGRRAGVGRQRDNLSMY